ncbi:MAG TPA: GyrI-like domain-containing protein [Chloroflexia bacterium]
MASRTTPGKIAPQILEMPAQKMAVVYTRGDPNSAGPDMMPALYGAVYNLKFALKKQGRDFKVAKLRARWLDAHLVPRDQWQGVWALPIPDDTTELVQKKPGIEVKIETWEYGTVAQILHRGPFSTEGPTVARLHAFIEETGYEIAGPHEEEYLTTLDAKNQKTLIRYPVRKK